MSEIIFLILDLLEGLVSSIFHSIIKLIDLSKKPNKKEEAKELIGLYIDRVFRNLILIVIIAIGGMIFFFASLPGV